jgi:hypothetical protein
MAAILEAILLGYLAAVGVAPATPWLAGKRIGVTSRPNYGANLAQPR